VLQKYRRGAGVENLSIGFAVYELQNGGGGGKLNRQFLQQSKACAKSQAFINLREVPNNLQLGTIMSFDLYR
jgi:hypothetical protein